jgi:Winged helix-turn-helix DNA-binding
MNADVDEARQLLEARASELRVELDRIQEAIKSLNGSSGPNNDPVIHARRRTRRDQALELVQRNPGITIKEIAARMGLKGPHYLYRVLPALEREKLISRKGDGYRAIGK